MVSPTLKRTYKPGDLVHVYNRGANKAKIFRDKEDKEKILFLFKRYLSKKDIRLSNGCKPNKCYDNIMKLSFVIMDNHYHLVFKVLKEKGVAKLMQRVMCAYSMYYNKKYSHSGCVFQGKYKCKVINSNRHYFHISRYVHLNPKRPYSYRYSSLKYYIKNIKHDYLNVSIFMSLFDNDVIKYLSYLKDYQDYKEYKKSLKL